MSKQLLDSVAGVGQTGRDVYQKYFESFSLADADSNLSCLHSRPRQMVKIANSMYKLKKPSNEPSFFSFNSFHDLCRLSKLIATEIVIFSANLWSDSEINVYHDFRFLGGCDNGRPVVYFLVTAADKKLYKLGVEQRKKFRVKTSYFASRQISVDTAAEHWSSALSRILGVPLADSTLLAPQNVAQDLQHHRQKLYEVWGEPVLFVALGKTKLITKTNICVTKKPVASHFVTVALVGPSLAQLSCVEVESIKKVVCFVGDRLESSSWQITLLSPAFRSYVLKQLVKTTHKDKLQNRDYLELPKVTREETKLAAAQLRAKKKKYVTRAEQKGRKCVCEICSDNSYSLNMAKVGPEKLMTYQPDVTELLRLMGLDTKENIESVEKLCELSVASMDIESTTLPLDLSPPVDRATGVDHSVIDGVILEGHLQKIQKPLMIAHMDALMDEPTVFVVKSDDEEAIYDMMKDYWTFVRGRQEECTREKKLLVVSLLDLLSEYKLRHTHFYMAWKPSTPTTSADNDGDYDVDIPNTWRQSVPGKLETALLRLTSNYAVFSFYG